MTTLVGEVVRRALSVDIAADYCKMRANFERIIKSLNRNAAGASQDYISLQNCRLANSFEL